MGERDEKRNLKLKDRKGEEKMAKMLLLDS